MTMVDFDVPASPRNHRFFAPIMISELGDPFDCAQDMLCAMAVNISSEFFSHQAR